LDMRAVTFDEGTGELGSRRGTFAEELSPIISFRRRKADV
jgi:hypothetical protein